MGEVGIVSHRVWRLAYGPCWCHGVPESHESFDFVRMSSTAAAAELGTSVLIVSDRVPGGSQSHLLALHRDVPELRIVITAASCPAAASFWDALPGGWVDVREVIPIDAHVEECISRDPDRLLVAIQESALVPGSRSTELTPAAQPRRLATASGASSIGAE